MSNNNFSEIKQKLQTMYKDNEQALHDLDWTKENSETNAVGELSGYDNHPADSGTELFEREKDMALAVQLKADQAHIQEALQAIENGSYGHCKVCHSEIPKERLEALPETLYCVEHSPIHHVPSDRPNEEAVLGVPFASFNNDYTEYNFYDEEDSYQEVASYGSSDTPSDFFEEVKNYSEAYENADEMVGSVEALEDFIGTDMYGKNPKIYPNRIHEKYEKEIDDYEDEINSAYDPYEFD